MKVRRTDYGMMVIRWAMAAPFVVAFVSGLRIATEAPECDWINLFAVLIAVTLAYVSYLAQAGLDIALKTSVFMPVEALDHNQNRHARHVRPIRLEVE